MDDSRRAELLSANLDASWDRRRTEAAAYNADLASGHIPVPLSLRLKWALKGSSAREEREREWRTKDGKKQPSLAWAIVEQFRVFYGLAVVFKIFGDSCQLCVSASPSKCRARVLGADDLAASFLSVQVAHPCQGYHRLRPGYVRRPGERDSSPVQGTRSWDGDRALPAHGDVVAVPAPGLVARHDHRCPRPSESDVLRLQARSRAVQHVKGHLLEREAHEPSLDRHLEDRLLRTSDPSPC